MAHDPFRWTRTMGLTDLFARQDGGRRRAVAPVDGQAEALPAAAEREALANLTLDIWSVLSEGFRIDEQAHEGAAFRTLAAPLFDELARLPSAQAPSLPLCRRLLFVLASELPERFAALHERIDQLLDQCRARDLELTVVKLGNSWQSDELERCRAMIGDALRGREVVRPGNADGTLPLVSELLAALLNVARPAPAVQAYGGQRESAADAGAASDPAPTPGESEGAVVTRVLRQVLDGTASAGRLGRVLEDQPLAERITDLAAENLRYRELLTRIGLLPRGAPAAAAPTDLPD